ncbi:hypothetical protein [Sphingomonas lacusdianchii]|uniref:hypothetical protein n=1 Tax=Sphingomonas lacusdianchii TaxID=2917992 RepID=UPI001F58DCE8|nr:hypothetical protein [Sphingomonas sp. JXJ CY 53]
MKHGIWATLDLDPTTDRSAIRKAYAARLKAMDVDADPAGFAALRAARDAALAGVAEVVTGPALEADLPPVPSVESEPETDPELAAFHEAINAHFHALEALLFPDHDAPPTPEELEAIEHHGLALLADPRLEQVDFAASAERWFSEMLAATIPRCDPLLEPAAATFGWIDRRDDYALPAEALAIVERIGAIRFTKLVGDPAHRLHRAWVELNRGDERRAPLWNSRKPRRELLSLIRDRYPMVESWLEPQRVADVDGPDTAIIGVPVWLIMFLIVVGLRIFFSLGGQPDVLPDTPPRITYVAEPNQIARELTGKGVVQLADIHPELATEIRATVTEMNATSSEGKMRSILNDLARRRISSGLAHAPDALLRDIARFDLDGKRAFAASDPIRCNDFRFPTGEALLTTALRARQTELIHRTVLKSDSVPVTGSGRFEISGAFIDDILRRSGVPEGRMVEALSGKGEHDDICRVEIALLETALEGGKEGMAVLRAMQPKVGTATPNPSN